MQTANVITKEIANQNLTTEEMEVSLYGMDSHGSNEIESEATESADRLADFASFLDEAGEIKEAYFSSNARGEKYLTILISTEYGNTEYRLTLELAE